MATSAKIAGQAVEQANRTNAQVEGAWLKAAEKIGEVVKPINDIAGRPICWRLNATIEAARAGEAGRGFVVVAVEVVSLGNADSDSDRGNRRARSARSRHGRRGLW